MPSIAGPNVANVPLAIAAATAAVPGSVANAPMLRVTVCGPPSRFTVGVNPTSQDGNACSSLDFQYGRDSSALGDAYRNLGRQPFMRRVDRSADHRRESRLDQRLAADDDEHSRAPRVARRGVRDAEEVATRQGIT
jgi:hypothetical protein